MNEISETRAAREEKLQGLGCRRKRVEDIRFTQGKGNYVDDIKLPGMLFGTSTARSTLMHASAGSTRRRRGRLPAWSLC